MKVLAVEYAFVFVVVVWGRLYGSLLDPAEN